MNDSDKERNNEKDYTVTPSRTFPGGSEVIWTDGRSLWVSVSGPSVGLLLTGLFFDNHKSRSLLFLLPRLSAQVQGQDGT